MDSGRGIAAAIVDALIASLVGRAIEPPEQLTARWPELAEARFRRGGLPVRVGGWALGQSTVSAITLWRTIFVAPGVPLSPQLLLHELRHVQQFQSDVTFPVRYIWESVRRGYDRNRYELDARDYADARLRDARREGADPPADHPPGAP